MDLLLMKMMTHILLMIKIGHVFRVASDRFLVRYITILLLDLKWLETLPDTFTTLI